MKVAAIVTSVSLVVTASIVSAQVTITVRQHYEAGLYDEALQDVADQRARDAATAGDEYLAAQILLKLDRRDQAQTELAQLSEQQDGVWRLVAQSAQALLDKEHDRALTLASQAVAQDASHFFAQYQLGLVHADREEWSSAASAFDRATQLDPSFAYAHYYAGLSYSKIKRMDRTGALFEAFLKLAPKAPERPAVESIMRTLRGR